MDEIMAVKTHPFLLVTAVTCRTTVAHPAPAPSSYHAYHDQSRRLGQVDNQFCFPSVLRSLPAISFTNDCFVVTENVRRNERRGHSRPRQVRYTRVHVCLRIDRLQSPDDPASQSP